MLKLKGSIKVSGDKSISHRALILSAMSNGKAKIRNLLESDDVMRTLKILTVLGVKIIKRANYWIVYGNGTNGFIEPNKALDCGNSGTTSRLMIGAVSSNPIKCTFIGDDSLSKRSMSRVTSYLEKMGAEINITNKDFLPLMITGSQRLLPMSHKIEKASAQIKTALILSGLNVHGKTRIIEKTITRDHTERLLKYLNVNFKIKKFKNGKKEIELNGPYEIRSRDITVSSDPSSASFFIVGALITPHSKITLKNIMLNPTRTAFIKILMKMGGKIKIKKTKNMCGEEVGDITSEFSKLKGITIPSKMSAQLIDEYPILSIAATQAKGKTVMNGLEELRHKESDRIESTAYNLRKIGYKIEIIKNNMTINPKDIEIKNTLKIRTFADHRIAMSFSILSIIYENKLIIDNEDCISISYPEFQNHLKYLLKSN